MVTVQYRRWCPPESPFGIEFPPELLHEIRVKHEILQRGLKPAARLPLRWIPRLNRAVTQSNGLLFGIRQENEVRLLAAHADPLPGAAEPVGTFVYRERGEVFLTDDDLASFERHQGAIALVIAGGRAGFFVREPDGSVQAIRSYEEFRVADAASRRGAAEGHPGAEEPSPSSLGWRSIWKRVAAFVALMAVPAGAFAYLRPLLPGLPLPLAIREEGGQLVIGWNPWALSQGGRLEIQDAGERTILLLPAKASGATYKRQGDDVRVRLSTGDRAGQARWEAPKFVAKMPRAPAPSVLLQDQVGALIVEAQKLRTSLAARQIRTKALAARMKELTATPVP